MAVQIVREPITLDELRSLAHGQFGEFVKAVVDVRLGVMAIGGELHADGVAYRWWQSVVEAFDDEKVVTFSPFERVVSVEIEWIAIPCS